MRHLARKFFLLILAIVITAGVIALVRDTVYQGQDFEVFYRAARAVLDGQNPYTIPHEGGMVFKYPPWILPVFLPLAFFSLSIAKWIWGITEILSLLAVAKWLLLKKVSSKVLVSLCLAFWGIWAVHAMDGQFTLPILAIALWAKEFEIFTAVFWSLSAKIFSLISMFGYRSRSPRRLLKDIILTSLLLAVFSVPGLLATPDRSPSTLLTSWLASARSGGVLLEGQKVRGRDNQGLPALVLRVTGVDATNSSADIEAFLVFAFFLGLLWRWGSKKLTEPEKWSGWLALGVVVHPLAWFHQFVLSFPLAAFSIERSFQSKKKIMIFISLIATIMIAGATRKTLGGFGQILEFYSIKSWGVILLGLVLVASQKNGFSRGAFPS